MGEARRVTGKPPITVRWVDVNKGDNTNPNVRSRLVARQIRQAGEDAIFAPTPPLETLRSILSLAMTDFPGRPQHVRDPTSERRTQVSAVDISRAYFNASTEGADPTYVMLPLSIQITPQCVDSSRNICMELRQLPMGGNRSMRDSCAASVSAKVRHAHVSS